MVLVNDTDRKLRGIDNRAVGSDFWAPAGLFDRYQIMASSADPAVCRLARLQLQRIQASMGKTASSSDQPSTQLNGGSGSGLVSAIEAAVGPLHSRRNGTLVGPCLWHNSRSGQCLVVWPAQARWWCSSCQRGGDLIQFVALRDGIDRGTARRQLRLPRRSSAELHNER